MNQAHFLSPGAKNVVEQELRNSSASSKIKITPTVDRLLASLLHYCTFLFPDFGNLNKHYVGMALPREKKQM